MGLQAENEFEQRPHKKPVVKSLHVWSGITRSSIMKPFVYLQTSGRWEITNERISHQKKRNQPCLYRIRPQGGRMWTHIDA